MGNSPSMRSYSVMSRALPWWGNLLARKSSWNLTVLWLSLGNAPAFGGGVTTTLSLRERAENGAAFIVFPVDPLLNFLLACFPPFCCIVWYDGALCDFTSLLLMFILHPPCVADILILVYHRSAEIDALMCSNKIFSSEKLQLHYPLLYSVTSEWY